MCLQNVMKCVGDRDRNVGRFDRAMRVSLGMIAAISIGWLHLTYPLQPGIIVLTLLSALFVPMMFITAATGSSGLYNTLGIDTCPDSVDKSPEQVWDSP